MATPDSSTYLPCCRAGSDQRMPASVPWVLLSPKVFIISCTSDLGTRPLLRHWVSLWGLTTHSLHINTKLMVTLSMSSNVVVQHVGQLPDGQSGSSSLCNTPRVIQVSSTSVLVEGSSQASGDSFSPSDGTVYFRRPKCEGRHPLSSIRVIREVVTHTRRV